MAIESTFSFPPPDPLDFIEGPVLPLVPASRTTEAGSTLRRDPYGSVEFGGPELMLRVPDVARLPNLATDETNIAPDEPLDAETAGVLRAEDIYAEVVRDANAVHDTIVD